MKEWEKGKEMIRKQVKEEKPARVENGSSKRHMEETKWEEEEDDGEVGQVGQKCSGSLAAEQK